jgi:hypothetical protein
MQNLIKLQTKKHIYNGRNKENKALQIIIHIFFTNVCEKLHIVKNDISVYETTHWTILKKV